MKLSIVPPDSLLIPWARSLSCTEIPLSYQLVGGLSLLGSLLRRQCWVDQKIWKVYPTQSVMFVGDSGIGKDTIINAVTAEVEKWYTLAGVPVLGGKTMEAVNARLQGLGSLAAGYIPAGELSSFFGQKDYQSGMIQEFTDLLSGGEKKDISTKGSLFASGGKPSYIHKPTLTLHGGSTVEWLHKAMPDGTMEGGFLGRFLILVEELGSKHIPLIKNLTRQELGEVDEARGKWERGIEEILTRFKTPTELLLLSEAQDYYTNWYHNRFKYFSKAVRPYANRSRDMVLRLGMLMAISRGHSNWIDEIDIEFGATVLREVGQEIDKVLIPPSSEGQAKELMLRMFPATSEEIWKVLGRRFPLRVLQNAQQLLIQSGEAIYDKRIWKRK